jgi:hypothetical protein
MIPVRQTLLATLASLPLLTPLAGWPADEAGFRRCREVPQAEARLRCYDALPLGASAQAQPTPSVAPPPPSISAPTPASSATGSSPSATVRAASPAASPEAGFGLQKPAVAELPAIESFIPGAFDGWGANSLIRLANGQVWQIVDGSSRYLARRDNPKVTVRRGALNSFFLDFEGDNRSPQVRRVQ